MRYVLICAAALFIGNQAVAQTPGIGVNANFVGTFSEPIVVLHDPNTVFTLSQGTVHLDHFGSAKWQFYHLTAIADYSTFGNLFITFENSDQLTVYAAGSTPPSGAINEIGVVTGGVGRFANASGTFRFTGQANLSTKTLQVTGVGTINLAQ